MKHFNMAVFLGWVFLVGACTPRNTDLSDPKSVLESYIAQSFAIQSAGDRSKLTQFLAGEARRRMEAWSDAQFTEALVQRKRKYKKLSWVDVRSVGNSETLITYELSFEDQASQDHGSAVTVTQRKVAKLRKVAAGPEAGWRIAEVRNLRELLEFADAMTLP